MTRQEKDLRDLRFLRSREAENVDMSSAAISVRLIKMGELCDLALLLRLPDIEYYQPDYGKRIGRDN